jgi:hypothetical protein
VAGLVKVMAAGRGGRRGGGGGRCEGLPLRSSRAELLDREGSLKITYFVVLGRCSDAEFSDAAGAESSGRRGRSKVTRFVVSFDSGVLIEVSETSGACLGVGALAGRQIRAGGAVTLLRRWCLSF